MADLIVEMIVAVIAEMIVAVIAEIVKSHRHSTVWDGADTLFGFNWEAFGISADRCFRDAHGAARTAHGNAGGEHFSADLNADHRRRVLFGYTSRDTAARQ
jgi:hypothetical protein